MNAQAFAERFRYFAGYDPYPWQTRLFSQLLSGPIPRQLAIPTGLGKTSVMLVWFLALAEQAEKGKLTLPRRLVYVVNRRTVVDQATAIAEGIRHKLLASTPIAATIRDSLARVSAIPDSPLAISTLRGEFADNGEWKQDPSRPSIVVGTVDMVGSKLLFAGFGDSRKRRPVHAGLVGQDTLLVHDEAHLDPAFAELLQQVEALQRKDAASGRGLQVMSLSATLRAPSGEAFSLSEDDRGHPLASKRLTAAKELRLHLAEKQKIPEKLAELAAAFEQSRVRVLVFVRSPRDAQEVASRVRKVLGPDSTSRVALLTGTMRGFERDRLLQTEPVFRSFLEATTPDATLYLVATSAGEVGVDLDADHLITELAPLDSLLQRLGRVNRRGGEGRRAQVHVVVPKDLDDGDPLAEALAATHELLRRWSERHRPCDLSPQNIETLLRQTPEEERARAYSPTPATVPLTDLHLDFLAATSLDELPPGSPDVPTLLHGLEPDEPEVTLFWRQELALLAAAGETRTRAWLELCPPAQRELVRLPLSHFLRDFLGRLKKRAGDEQLAKPVAVFGPGRFRLATLGEVAQWGPGAFAFAYLGLDASLGGLDPRTGMPDPSVETPAGDVAELSPSDEKTRIRILQELTPEGAVQLRTLAGEPWEKPADWELLGAVPIAEDEECQVVTSLCLFAPRPEAAREEAEHVTGHLTLDAHISHVEGWAKLLAQNLHLEQELEEALAIAARWHDRGKASKLWQYFARAENAPEPLAKADRYRDPRVLAGFRHEWASLRLFWQAHREHRELPVLLAFHLIASHHGWGRPHFPPSTNDPDAAPSAQHQLAIEVANTYAALQHRLGWWRLAWLEAVFRAADALASRYGPPPESFSGKEATAP